MLKLPRRIAEAGLTVQWEGAVHVKPSPLAVGTAVDAMSGAEAGAVDGWEAGALGAGCAAGAAARGVATSSFFTR